MDLLCEIIPEVLEHRHVYRTQLSFCFVRRVIYTPRLFLWTWGKYLHENLDPRENPLPAPSVFKSRSFV